MVSDEDNEVELNYYEGVGNGFNGTMKVEVGMNSS